MKNILLIISAYMVGYDNGKYYHNSIGCHLDRYKKLGKITLCCRKTNKKTCDTVVDFSDVSFREIFPELAMKDAKRNMQLNKNVIRSEIEKADLIIAYMPSIIGAYAIKQAELLSKKSLAVGISCPWDVFWNHSMIGKLIAPYMWWTMKRAFRRADYALYVTKEFLQRRYPSDGLSCGVSDVVLNERDEAYLQRRLLKISNTSFAHGDEIKLITSAAVNVKYKRQQDVIKAISYLVDKYNLHYYLVGGGDQSMLRKVAKKYHVEDRVHFLGFVNHDEVFSLLESMDIYVQPSKQEGLPRALVEAMSVAIPCIGSSTGGIPELLGSNNVFKRGNVRDFRRILVENLVPHKLRDNAIACFSKSAEYETIVLNEQRNNFFDEIVCDIDANIKSKKTN